MNRIKITSLKDYPIYKSQMRRFIEEIVMVSSATLSADQILNLAMEYSKSILPDKIEFLLIPIIAAFLRVTLAAVTAKFKR